jgi:hypothetical protein
MDWMPDYISLALFVTFLQDYVWTMIFGEWVG